MTTSVDKEIFGIAKLAKQLFRIWSKLVLMGTLLDMICSANETEFWKKRPPLLSRTKTGVRVKTKGPLDTVGNKLICSQITSLSFFCSFSSTMQLDFSIKKYYIVSDGNTALNAILSFLQFYESDKAELEWNWNLLSVRNIWGLWRAMMEPSQCSQSRNNFHI